MAVKSPPPKTPKKKPVGRPKKNAILRAAKGFKTGATGETRNSPMTDPNIIFWLGMGLIVFSGWSNGRIQFIFENAWNAGAAQQNGSSWFTQIKILGSQFLFLFILVITARAIPPLSRIWLVIVGGLWILYLMKNPQVLQLLNWASVGATNQNQYNSFVQELANGAGQTASDVGSQIVGNQIIGNTVQNIGQQTIGQYTSPTPQNVGQQITSNSILSNAFTNLSQALSNFSLTPRPKVF